MPAREPKVWFLGAGPGAADLLTVRAARIVSEADVVVWGRALMPEAAVTEHARADAELVSWPPASMDDILAVYDRAAADRLVVARLMWGDPTLFSTLRDEAREVRARGLALEVVPGVSSLGAVAAALQVELTRAPEVGPPLILTPARGGPHAGQGIAELAGHGATVAMFMASDRGEELQRELLRGGYGPDTPCAVASYVSWEGETVVTCRLDGLAEAMASGPFERFTIVLAGPALDGAGAPAG